MADTIMNTKGQGKRAAEDEADDGNSDPIVAPATVSYTKAPISRLTAPQILRRHRHRRENIAATVWGRCLPGSDAPQPFSVYKAILRHPNLFFQFTIRLPQKAIIDLYAIDKEFHYRFNKYSTSIIHDFASHHAPQAAYIFSWVLFPELCISDPMLRPMDGRPHLARDIPSLRWTQMVIHRDTVVRNILAILAVNGHRVPRETHIVLMKYWLLIEMNNSTLRMAFITDSTVWTDQDIYFFHLFLMKLDMHLNHPVYNHGYIDLSHMLLTQNTLLKLCKVLAGKQTMDYDDLTDMLIRTYHEEDLDLDANPWLADEEENGVIVDETGILSREGWDMLGDRMDSPVDLVCIEAIDRGLDIQEYLIDFMMYGYIDPDKKQNLPAPRRWRGEKKISVPKEPWLIPSVMIILLATLDKKYDIKPEGGDLRKVSVRRVRQSQTVIMWDPSQELGGGVEGIGNDAAGNTGEEMEVDE